MIYLTVKDIIRINAKLISKTSAGEMIGVRDASALDRCVKQPMQGVFGKEIYSEIHDKAAILAITLAKRHPFQNANKRTALVAMATFLIANGYSTSFSQEEAVQFILNITTSDKTFDVLKEEVTSYLKNSGKIRSI